MFVAEKSSSLLPLLPKPHRRGGKAPAASRFDAALAARLRALLPLPASPLAALARVAALLALTLGDAAPALAGAGEGGDDAVAAHLDAGLALLDACNAIAARLDRLRRRRLLARLALRILASSSSSSSVGRARAALADREREGGGGSPPLPSLPFNQPRGGRRLSGAARVIVAVNAVSSLAAAAAAAVLGEGGAAASAFPRVSAGGDFVWADAFNAVSSQLSAANASEVQAIDEAVQKLSSVLSGGERAVDEAALHAAAQEVEKRTEELTARLDRLSDAVNAVFRAALGLRNAELGIFMVGPAEKTCKY